MLTVRLCRATLAEADLFVNRKAALAYFAESVVELINERLYH
jgi:hypothetical protein